VRLIELLHPDQQSLRRGQGLIGVAGIEQLARWGVVEGVAAGHAHAAQGRQRQRSQGRHIKPLGRKQLDQRAQHMGVGRFAAEFQDRALERFLGRLRGKEAGLGMKAVAACQFCELQIVVGLAPPSTGAGPDSWPRVHTTGLRMHGAPVGRGRSCHGLPPAPIQGQHVIAHQGAAQLIGGPLRQFGGLGFHQQIGVRVAIPISPAPGAEQPDAAWHLSQGLGQLLLQRLQPTFVSPAAQPFKGAQFVASHALKLGADNGCRRQTAGLSR